MKMLQRARARDQARDLIRERIVTRDFDPGRRLDEAGLARDIGASRTPVREALIALEQEGLVLSRPNHGFVVAPVDEAVVRQLYPIIGALERAAVEATGDGLKDLAPKLAALNDRLRDEKRKAARYDLDRGFHRVLVSGCGNARLLQLLEMHWNQARRVDGGKTRGMADHEGSHAKHAAIVEAAGAGDAARAGALLCAHWREGENVVLQWMRRLP